MARLTPEQLKALMAGNASTAPAPSSDGSSAPPAPSGAPAPNYQPYQPTPITPVAETPSAAAIRQTKENLFKTKHPVLNFISQATTGHTQKFAQTLGSAASVVTGDVKKQNAAKMAEEQSRLELAKLLETASPEQIIHIKNQLAQESNTRVATELDPTLLKTNRQVFGEGLGTAMEALSGGQLGGGTSGVLSKAVPEVAAKSLGVAIGRGALKGGIYGALGGIATGAEENKSAGGIALSGAVGGVTGGVVGGAVGAASYGVGKLYQASLEKKAQDLVGKAMTEKGVNLDRAVDAVGTFDKADLGKINNDYGNLAEVADSRVKEMVSAVDAKLPTDKVPISTFDKIVPYGTKGNVTASNPVETSLQMLDDLYEAKGDTEAQAAIGTLQEQAQTQGLSAREVNDLARQFGSEYSGFNPKTGNPLTSHNAEAYEFTRSALKDASRSLMPDDATKLLDAKMGDMILLRDSANEMVDNVQNVNNKLNERGIWAKLGSVVGKVIDVGNFAKNVLAEVMPMKGSAEAMNAVEAQAQLTRNLTLANKLLNMTDEQIVKYLAKHAAAVAAAQAISATVPVTSRIVGGGAEQLVNP